MTELTGKIVLGPHRYGKAENRVVRIVRDTDRHEIRDLNVSSCLHGDFDAAHLEGDQGTVLPTDSQKQTIYSYAKEKGVEFVEEYGLALARHFVDDVEPVRSARIEIEEYAWERVVVDGAGHDHTWTRKGSEVRTAAITVEDTGTDRREWVVGGLKDLVVLKSTGSEFQGFLTDPYTVLEPAEDRIMATSSRHAGGSRRPTSTGTPSTRACAPPSSRCSRTCIRRPCNRACTRWAAPCSSATRRSPRSACPHRTSTTSSTIWHVSEWRTPVRSSTPTTGPTD